MDTEGQEPGPHGQVSDLLVLAAIERAARHGAPEVWTAVVAEHLGIEHTAHNTRRLRAQLERLTAPQSRCVDRTERHGREYWTLTVAGEGWLRNQRAKGNVGELPESPQYREWREARATAAERIDAFRDLLSAALEDAVTAVSSPAEPPSAGWFELGERLAAALWLLGSATYCLGEWPEPGDAHADLDADSGPLPGRRAVGAWKDKEALAKGDPR
jgi:hypothetical protein